MKTSSIPSDPIRLHVTHSFCRGASHQDNAKPRLHDTASLLPIMQVSNSASRAKFERGDGVGPSPTDETGKLIGENHRAYLTPGKAHQLPAHVPALGFAPTCLPFAECLQSLRLRASTKEAHQHVLQVRSTEERVWLSALSTASSIFSKKRISLFE